MRFIVEETETVTRSWLVEAGDESTAIMRVRHKEGASNVRTQLSINSEMKFEVKEDDFKFEKR